MQEAPLQVLFFDSYGHAVVPLLGGLAIRDINAEETQTLGYFSPSVFLLHVPYLLMVQMLLQP